MGNLETIISESVDYAAQLIKSGQLVAFPTETVYGLGASINNEDAVKKIYQVKGRPSDNPLILHISDVNMLENLIQNYSSDSIKLIEKFWPGPLTLVFKKNKNINDVLTCGLKTIAVRMPKSELALQLINKVGSPLFAPSANLSGKPSPTSYLHVLEDFRGKIPCILKGPDCEIGLESTVIDCSEDDNFKILRMGAISLEQIENTLGRKINQTSAKDLEKSPGTRYKHYSPIGTVFIYSEEIVPKVKSAFIGLTQPLHQTYEKIQICESLEEYARLIYAFFRSCDQDGIQNIYCQIPCNSGLGEAIKERIFRASES
jgi:L-threonylcarbamoyladenylate synthase